MLSCKRDESVSDQSQDTNHSTWSTVEEPTETVVHRILALLETRSREDPSRIAVIEGTNEERKLTCGELRNRVLATASFLRSRGFGRGDTATLAIRNTTEFPIFYLGVWAAGGIVSGSGVGYTAHETQYQLIDSSPKIVLTTEEYLPTIMGVLNNCPSVEKVICIRSTSGDLPEGIIDFNDVISHGIDGRAPQAHLDDIAVIYYTSGSTGLRKGVLHTHKSIHFMAKANQSNWRTHTLSLLGMDERDIMNEHHLLIVPCYYPPAINKLNVHLMFGAPIVLLNGFQDGTLLKCIEKYKPSSLYGSPALVMYLSKQDNADLSSVKMVTCSGTFLKETVGNAFLHRFPHVEYVLQVYGLTEAPTCHVPSPSHKGFNSSVGVPNSIFQRKLINVDTHQPCAQGEAGEVYLKGPGMTIGYLNRPESTEQLFDSDGWMRTGDLGYVDELGQLHIVDRLKEMLKVINEKGIAAVSPSEIEDVIMSSPKVADVGVVGIPHEEREFLLRAYVVKSDDSLTEEEVENVVAEKLSEIKFITGGVRFIDKIPRSRIGKLQRRELMTLSQMD